MSKEKSLHSSPQLVFEEQQRVVVDPSHKEIMSLYRKSEQSGHSFDTLLEVYRRGFMVSGDQQSAFNRVNSFIAEGKAYEMDKDLVEKRGLWDNIHAKRERIKHGSGEHMRKPGSKGAPTAQALKQSQTKEAYTGAEPTTSNTDSPSSRFVGTNELTDTYANMTPGQSKAKTIKRIVKEVNEDKKGYKNPTGGLTQKGRDHYNRETGGHLKAPVTTPPSKLKKDSKAAGRRRSFCARMGGVKGPMRDEHGKPTRKALALRKWNC